MKCNRCLILFPNFHIHQLRSFKPCKFWFWKIYHMMIKPSFKVSRHFNENSAPWREQSAKSSILKLDREKKIKNTRTFSKSNLPKFFQQKTTPSEDYDNWTEVIFTHIVYEKFREKLKGKLSSFPLFSGKICFQLNSKLITLCWNDVCMCNCTK